MYYYLFLQMNCAGPTFQRMADKIIQHKCSMIFNEAQYIAKDFKTLEKYKDLFIEQSKNFIITFYHVIYYFGLQLGKSITVLGPRLTLCTYGFPRLFGWRIDWSLRSFGGRRVSWFPNFSLLMFVQETLQTYAGCWLIISLPKC